MTKRPRPVVGADGNEDNFFRRVEIDRMSSSTPSFLTGQHVGLSSLSLHDRHRRCDCHGAHDMMIDGSATPCHPVGLHTNSIDGRNNNNDDVGTMSLLHTPPPQPLTLSSKEDYHHHHHWIETNGGGGGRCRGRGRRSSLNGYWNCTSWWISVVMCVVAVALSTCSIVVESADVRISSSFATPNTATTTTGYRDSRGRMPTSSITNDILDSYDKIDRKDSKPRRRQQQPVRLGRSLMEEEDADHDTDPAELNVTSPMRQNGNPLIQQSLPIAFGLTLSILPETSREVLVTFLDTTIEEYLQRRYQNLIELQAAVFGSDSASSIELQDVDLTLSLVNNNPGRMRNRRRMTMSTIQQSSEIAHDPVSRSLQVASDQVTVQGVGEIGYSLEVDGSNPTPDEVKGTWMAVFEEELMTQGRIEELIEDSGIESIVRVDQVTVLDPSDVVDVAATNADGSTNNGGDEVTRPSTLSIVFGFLLVGIATIGLLAYMLIFYRKRQKRLRKKRMMQESISYPSASIVAARASSAGGASASASSASNTTRNANNTSAVNSSMASNNSALPPTPVLPANPMIISRDDEEFSEETSYKGLENSIGSEDPSDSFAKELQLAASLDQRAWDDFQRKKEELERNRMLQSPSSSPEKGSPERIARDPEPLEQNISVSPIRPDRENSSTALVGSPAGVQSDPEAQDISIEADLAGNTGYARSFPYGDETPDDANGSDVAGRWEPYNSRFSPSPNVANMPEEKKDDLSPTSFFAQQLQNIETDLARFNEDQERRLQANILRSATSTSDDVAASDVVSEVDELSKYVRRYERRKDRRMQREHKLHERLRAARAGSLTIGMDGQLYVPNQHDNGLAVTNSHSSSLSPQSAPSRDVDDPALAPSNIAGYTATYRKYQSRRSRGDNLTFVSDDEGSDDDVVDEPGSERSQRLGISPFKASAPDQRYLSTSPQHDNVNGISTVRSDLSKSISSHKSRLADLRNNDAIIDASQSDVNPSYDRDRMTAAMKAAPQIHAARISSTGQITHLNIQNADANNPTTTTTTATMSPSRVKQTTNKQFNRLRGMFEQKSNEQPEPIYPPTEHWQYGVHKNEAKT